MHFGIPDRTDCDFIKTKKSPTNAGDFLFILEKFNKIILTL